MSTYSVQVSASSSSSSANKTFLKPPPIKKKGRKNWAGDTYGIIGGPPLNVVSEIFNQLMNRSYAYLLFFIAQSIVALVLVFWGPFAAIILNNPNVSVQGATTAIDALAVTFAGLFSVPSAYLCASPGAVLLLTFLNAVGKLAIASLTALLVLKISRVPNNWITSDRAIVHKRNGKWTISLRIGLLHKQVVRNVTIRLFCYAQVGNGVSILNLSGGPFADAGGGTIEGPEPMNIRHVVDETSPLKEIDFNDANALKKAMSEGFDIHIQGFDSLTGRSCGCHSMYSWRANTLIYCPNGKMADSSLKMTEEHIALRKSNKGKTWGIDWVGFNGIKMSSEEGEPAI
eukprot:g14424.t1